MAKADNKNTIADLVKDMVSNMDGVQSKPREKSAAPRQNAVKATAKAEVKAVAKAQGGTHASSYGKGLTADDYPLADKHPELLKTQLGKEYDNVTLDNAMSGNVVNEDIKISPDVLEYQAQIAESTGKVQLAENFRRAAELAVMPDDLVLEIYNMLRPNRSTKKELADLADRLRTQYNAPGNAKLVEEAMGIYEKRGILVNG